MSGQWSPENPERKSFSCFPRILQVASDLGKLRRMVDHLLPDEVEIASIYVDNLIRTRPIKQASREGWETTINGPGYVDKEDRAHMAMLELESDPK